MLGSSNEYSALSQNDLLARIRQSLGPEFIKAEPNAEAMAELDRISRNMVGGAAPGPTRIEHLWLRIEEGKITEAWYIKPNDRGNELNASTEIYLLKSRPLIENEAIPVTHPHLKPDLGPLPGEAKQGVTAKAASTPRSEYRQHMSIEHLLYSAEKPPGTPSEPPRNLLELLSYRLGRERKYEKRDASSYLNGLREMAGRFEEDLPDNEYVPHLWLQTGRMSTHVVFIELNEGESRDVIAPRTEIGTLEIKDRLGEGEIDIQFGGSTVAEYLQNTAPQPRRPAPLRPQSLPQRGLAGIRRGLRWLTGP